MKALIIFDKSKLFLMNKKFLLIPMLFLMLIPFTNVYAEHVLDVEAFAQYLDIAQLEAEQMFMPNMFWMLRPLLNILILHN
jgi:hypothetical protein